MKKITVITAILFSAVSIYGQNTKSGDLNQQISVAKNFMPSVDRASKLEIQPQTTDTVMLRPATVDCGVIPKPWTSGFSVAPISPATVNEETRHPRYPFYLKAGGGYPGQTLFDFHANTTGKGRNNLGFYLNHYGQLADIDVEDYGKTNAKSTRNRTGLFGTVGVGRYALRGEIGWDYDIFSLYGDHERRGKNVPMQHYSTPRARIVFGDDYYRLSHFNFRLGADGYLLSDRYDNKENGMGAFAEVAKRNITLKANIESYKGGGVRDGIRSMIVRVGPRYELRTKSFKFMMGAVFAYEENTKETEYLHKDDDSYFTFDHKDQDEIYFLPEMELRFSFVDGKVSPYAKLNSSLTANSLRRLTTLNPYLGYENQTHQVYRATVEYNLRAGVSGTVGSRFSYNIFAGGDRLKNNPVFGFQDINFGSITYISIRSIYPYFITKTTVLTAGAELEARIGGNFTIVATGQYFKNKVKELDEAFFLPKYTASLGIIYDNHDEFSMRAGVKIRGEHGFILNGDRDGSAKAPTAVNVYLGAQYNLSSTFGIFIEGDNLANQKLYPYPFYQGVGINVSAGVKVRF